jgi:ketosteroid isomerase-like protein
MSQENVEIVKGFLPAPDVNIVPLVRDDELWLALVDASHISFAHADYESVLKGLPDGDKTYVGADGERALWLDWLAPWVSYRVGAEEYVDLGERVLVRSYAFGRSEASTAEVKLTHGDIWTIRRGKLARVEYYTTRAEALKAAGLEE